MTVKEANTWRELLGKIISDTQEKQRIAQSLNINPVTLSRWCTSSTRPRYDNIRLLLEALPHYRTQFAEFLADDFPQLFHVQTTQEIQVPEIPSTFYGQVLNAYTSSPTVLRAPMISTLILQQVLTHIDPNQQGIAAIIIQCMQPDEQNKIRSLRKTYGRGTISSISHDYQTQLFGAESPTGQAIVSGHPIMLQCSNEKTHLFSEQSLSLGESCVAYPIMQADRTAGCLLIVSNEPYYFTQTRLDQIKSYADLLALAFEPEEFYDLCQIELGIMPEGHLQQKYLAGFQERVMQKMIQAVQRKHSLTRLQAELRVWQELEKELLELACNVSV